MSSLISIKEKGCGVSKLKVKEITITRGEGPIIYAGKTFIFNSIKDANCHICYYNNTYPRAGYDKHDVIIKWEDGTEYKFRLDAIHPDNQYYSYSSNSIDGRIHRAFDYYSQEKNRRDEYDNEAWEFFRTLNNQYELE